MRRIARLAHKFERDHVAAVKASGHDEAFGDLLSLCVELQNDFAKAALAIKPKTMEGIGIWAAIAAAGATGYEDGRPVGYCEELAFTLASTLAIGEVWS
jgi:hypothetical protein